ncbi:hypothetical protein TNIN_496981 [Trichonephila inaurata madagascariensis]|uniref:Uncharacterized protein n=1 Tax=Trichonephila inaurata madagascariensis TaxID=2747483 RepID=A0A8X6X627_9ARAC|nr:hypothetical protein TNIN_496981 [Trichonephila inaurata madagascariensis]
MASSMVSASEIEEGYTFCKVCQTISIALVAVVFLAILKYLLWRRRFAHLVPGKPPRFFNLLGNLSEMSFTEKSKKWILCKCVFATILRWFFKVIPKTETILCVVFL